MTRTTICIWIALATLALSMTGCTTKRQAFPGHTSNQVWTAMRAVAESPEYDDWRLIENRVWVDDEDARMEIYRETRRVLRRAGARPLNERRTWRFQLLLDGEDPPTITFVSRGMGVPAHAQAEADRFFIDVRKLLGPEIGTVQRRPATEPQDTDTAHPAADESVEDSPAEEDAVSVPFDVDDLD